MPEAPCPAIDRLTELGHANAYAWAHIRLNRHECQACVPPIDDPDPTGAVVLGLPDPEAPRELAGDPKRLL